MFHTSPPKTIRLSQPDVVVDADLPKLCDSCLDPFTPELCDDCFERRAAHARRRGMPEYLIPQLRPRIHRIREAEAKGMKVYPLSKESADQIILEHLQRKQEVKDVVARKRAAGRAAAAAKAKARRQS